MVNDAWLALLHAAQLSPQLWLETLKASGSAEELLAETARTLLARGLPAEAVSRLHAPDQALLDRWRQWLDGRSRTLVTFGGPLYPARLAEIPTAPLALWVEGPEP